MGAQDNIEKVMRNIHILLSKSEPYENHPGKVIIEKQQVLDLLAELNDGIYAIMDEYEMTERSRDKAEREFRKKGDSIIWDASRKAEDVYAASVLYTGEALNNIQEIMKDARESVDKVYREMSEKLKVEQKAVSQNQSELMAQLRDLRDTEKYLRLIENRNAEIEKERISAGKIKEKEVEKSIYADRKTEIKVNAEVLEKLGYSDDITGHKESHDSVEFASSDKGITDETIDGELIFSSIDEAIASKNQSGTSKKRDLDPIGKVLKSITGGKK